MSEGSSSWEDRDSVRIELPREGGRILPRRDPGNLRGGEGDDVVRGIVTEIHIEIMEVAARGAEDDDVARRRDGVVSAEEWNALAGVLGRGARLDMAQV